MTTPTRLLVLAGQSNMEGQGDVADLDSTTLPANCLLWEHETGTWSSSLNRRRARFGPEWGLARYLASVDPDHTYGFIKYAIGGTSLIAWEPEWDAETAATTDNADVGPLCSHLIERINAATATCPEAKPVGILWMQGERECRYPEAAEQYHVRFERLMSFLQQRLGSSNLPIVLGRVNPEPGPGRPAVNTVRSHQVELASQAQRGWIDCDDLSKHSDALHYNTQGVSELGERFGRTWWKLSRSIQLPRPAANPEHGMPARVDLRLGGNGGERHVLMIGNSLTHFNLMPSMLGRLLSEVTGELWVCSSVTRGGATLAWHRQMGYADRILETAGPNAFAAVTVQDQSRRPAQAPDASQADFAHYFQLAKRMGAQAYGYLTWDLRDEPPHHRTMAHTLSKAAHEHATVAPVGTGWVTLGEQLPHIERYTDDGKHPTAIGSFLAAAVLCRTISGTCPTSVPPLIAAGGYAHLDIAPADAEQLLAIAATCSLPEPA